jgi:hypothetical protein
MSSLVILQSDPTDPDVVYICSGPEMSSVMGGFGPARFIGSTSPIKGASYVIRADDLYRFGIYCINRSVKVLDRRGSTGAGADTPRTRPPWAERPLPECARCGQPVARGVVPSFCPNCGAPWEAVEVVPGRDRHEVPTRVCASCGLATPAAFTHCTGCGHAER